MRSGVFAPLFSCLNRRDYNSSDIPHFEYADMKKIHRIKSDGSYLFSLRLRQHGEGFFHVVRRIFRQDPFDQLCLDVQDVAQILQFLCIIAFVKSLELFKYGVSAVDFENAVRFQLVFGWRVSARETERPYHHFQ